MARRDLYSGVAVSGPDAAVRTADANMESVDMQGYGSLLIIADVGASGDTLSGSVLWELEVEDSPDDSVWTDCADADLLNSVTGTNTGTFAVIDDPAEDSQHYITGYIGEQRYVRVRIEATGTHTNGTPIGITYVRGHPTLSPVNATT